jgi:hypothetical protein
VAISETSIARDIAVQFYHIAAPGRLMQTINVLGQHHNSRDKSLQFSQRKVTGVRLDTRHELPTIIIPSPHQFGIAPKRLRRCQFLGVVRCPKPGLCIAKGGNPALFADACAAQDDKSVGLCQA